MNTYIIGHLKKHFDLSEIQFTEIAECITITRFKKKQIIVSQGDNFLDLGFITKGLFKSYTLDSSHTPQVLSFSLENYWLSDMYSHLTGNGSLTTIEALEDGEVFMIKKSDLEKLFVKHHEIETHFRKLLEKRTARLLQDRYNMMSLNAKQRYENFMHENENLVQRLLQKDIASHLGIFPESLSRIRKSLITRKKKTE